MKDKVLAEIMGEAPIEISKKTTLLELSANFQNRFKYPILLAKVNNELFELNKTLNKNSVVEFLDLTDSNGFRTYQRSLSFVMICAAKEVIGTDARVVIEHSINKNYYCEIFKEGFELTEDVVKDIEERMIEIVKADFPIEKLNLAIEDAIELAKEFYLDDKVKSLKFRRTSNVNFYKLSWFYDYFYGKMAPSTGVLKKFKLTKAINGFLLQFPREDDLSEVREPKVYKKISRVFRESSKWARILNVDTVGALNECICQGNLGDIIRVNEALHEKKIATIADMIHEQRRRLVLVAGPSSSGKTTFAHRLAIQLRVNGVKTRIISIDDYFRDQEREIIMEDSYDLESIKAINSDLLNEHLTKLLDGETVNIPSFNFVTGKSEDKGKLLKLQPDEILIVEGIHGLNEMISSDVKKIQKFKVFISALTQLNVDDHNRIPTTDTRIIRRIVRDSRFRKLDALDTIKMWPTVTRGEMLNIFPYQEDADAVFNSALIYELAVLKSFVEPILFNIDESFPQYAESRRLIKFLDCFLGVSSEEVPKNSLLREFIGGSCFN